MYNLAVQKHENDMDKFYDVLLPFLTQRPLETSLVHAEESAIKTSADAVSKSVCGPWRRPQVSAFAACRGASFPPSIDMFSCSSSQMVS